MLVVKAARDNFVEKLAAHNQLKHEVVLVLFAEELLKLHWTG